MNRGGTLLWCSSSILQRKGNVVIIPFDVKKEVHNILHFLSENGTDSSTFYYTENNNRVYAKTKRDILHLFKNSVSQYVEHNERNDIRGVILIWRGLAGNTQRNYVKVVGRDSKTIENLLTILLWNTEKELYVKLHRNSHLVRIFNKKGFQFFHGRGKEILLRRPLKYGSYFNKRRDKGKESNRRQFSKQ